MSDDVREAAIAAVVATTPRAVTDGGVVKIVAEDVADAVLAAVEPLICARVLTEAAQVTHGDGPSLHGPDLTAAEQALWDIAARHREDKQ